MKTTEEYAPVAKNCSAHYHAFYRVANKTEEVLASIKSQEVYQNETDALKEKIRKYTDQLSNAKEQYANETLEQNALSLEKENKTMECFSHLDLHKRMVKMLKKLKKAMAAVKNNKNGSPSFIEADSKLSFGAIGKRIWIKVNEYIEEQNLEATSVSTMPVANAFRILVTDIQKEKDMKASKCEEDLAIWKQSLRTRRPSQNHYIQKFRNGQHI